MVLLDTLEIKPKCQTKNQMNGFFPTLLNLVPFLALYSGSKHSKNPRSEIYGDFRNDCLSTRVYLNRNVFYVNYLT